MVRMRRILFPLLVVLAASCRPPEENKPRTPSSRPPLPVRAVRAKRGPIQSLIYGQGTARAVRRDFLRFEQAGKVTWVKRMPEGRSMREGDPVKGPAKAREKGELLAKVDDRDAEEQVKLAQASLEEALRQEESLRANTDRAKADLDLARVDLARTKELFKSQNLSQSQYDQQMALVKTSEAALLSVQAQVEQSRAAVEVSRARLRQAEVALEHTRIYAPFDGIVAYLNYREGDYFSPNSVNASTESSLLSSVPMVVLDPAEFEVTLDVPSFDGALVKTGQPAMVLLGEEMPGKAGLHALGAVWSVNPSISPGGRAVQVKVRTREGSKGVRDGLFVACWIIVAEKADAVVIPPDTEIYRDSKAHVFVIDKATKRVTLRRVEEGLVGPQGREITSGVVDGDLLVTEGRSRLVDGAVVEVIGVEESD